MDSSEQYIPPHIFIALGLGPKVFGNIVWSIAIEGDFIEPVKRKLFHLIPVKYPLGRVCPAVEDMLWSLVHISGKALVRIHLFDPFDFEAGEIERLQNLLKAYSIKFRIHIARQYFAVLFEMNSRADLKVFMRLWQGEWYGKEGSTALPVFDICVVSSSSDTLAGRHEELLSGPARKAGEIMISSSEYVISDPTEGTRDHFYVATADRNKADEALDMIKRVWQSYGVEVRSKNKT